MISILIASFAWILHSLFNAYVQAFYYDLFPQEKAHPNIHWAYVLSRGIVLVLILWNLYYEMNGVLLAIYGLCLCLIYSFFHNGMYYRTRNKLNPKVYPKGWWDSSVSSQATIELGVGMRTAMMVIGFVGIYLIIKSI